MPYAVAIKNTLHGFYISDRSVASLLGAKTKGNANTGFYAAYMSTISASSSESNDNGYYGYRAIAGSKIYAESSVATDNDIADYLPSASTAQFPNFGSAGSWIYGGTETESKAVLEEIQAEDSTGILLKNDGGDTVATVRDDGTFYSTQVKLGIAGAAETALHIESDAATVFTLESDATTGNQLLLRGKTNANNQIIIGYDSDDDVARIATLTQGTSFRPLEVGASRLQAVYEIQAADYFAGDGSQGLTVDVVVKGSDGNNCTLTYKDGLLTAETCP
jgi:hypothetical protein